MSGNSNLTKDLIIDGLDTAGSNISAEFAIDPIGTCYRLSFALISFAASLYIYISLWKKSRSGGGGIASSSFYMPKIPLGFVYILWLVSGFSDELCFVRKGAGDHGDDPFKKSYARLAGLNSNVLHSAAYIYYPTSLMRDESEAKRLRRNTKQVTSTLDFYQTIQGIIGSIDQNITHEGCAKGVDLTSSDIDDDRLVISTNSVSQHGGSLLWALSNKEKALYYRKSKFPSPDLGQGKDSVYILEFGNCTLNSEAHCIGELNSEGKEVFRTAIRALKNITETAYRTSQIVNFFSDKLGMKEQ